MSATRRGCPSRLVLGSGGAAVLALTLLSCGPPPADPPEETPSNQPKSVLEGEKCYSSGDEELIIRDFFSDRRGGVFLDVGAAWPVAKSNTAYLEKRLGWSGIAVDALEEYAEAWRTKRPRSRFFVYFVTDDMETVLPFYRSELTDVSTYLKGDLERRLNRDGSPVEFAEVEVASITLTKLLDDNGISDVDFVSIDIEGAEMMALRGFDIDRFKPELFCVEAKPRYRKLIIEYLEAHGYRRLERYAERDPMNYYFAPAPSGAER